MKKYEDLNIVDETLLKKMSGGGSGPSPSIKTPFNKIWVPSKDDIMFHVGSNCYDNCFGTVYEYDMSEAGTGGPGARIQLQGNTRYRTGDSNSNRASVTNAVLAYVKVDLTDFTHFFFHTKRTSSSGRLYAFISDVDPVTLESISGDDNPNRWAHYFTDSTSWEYYECNITEWNGEHYVGIAMSASSNEATAVYNFEFMNFKSIENIPTP